MKQTTVIIGALLLVALVGWWRLMPPPAEVRPTPHRAFGVTVQEMPEPAPPPHRHRRSKARAVTGTGRAAQRSPLAAPTVDLTRWNARQAEIIARAGSTDWIDDWYTPPTTSWTDQMAGDYRVFPDPRSEPGRGD